MIMKGCEQLNSFTVENISPRAGIELGPLDQQVRALPTELPGLLLCTVDTWSGNILSFLLPLFQEGQLSVTGESMCTKYWLTA